MTPENKNPSFEDCILVINEEIKKRKPKWRLDFLSYMDYQDVSQIIRLHIFQKWHLYDNSKPLIPWLNRIIANQIKNLLRNNFTSHAKPCVKCSAAEENDGCRIYGTQCAKCPLYKNWEKNKKNAYNLSIAQPLDFFALESSVKFSDNSSLERNAQKIHNKMKDCLKPSEWKIYKLLYIEGKSEEEAAKKLSYKTTEKNRPPGYKHIQNVKKIIITKVKKLLKDDQIDII